MSLNSETCFSINVYISKTVTGIKVILAFSKCFFIHPIKIVMVCTLYYSYDSTVAVSFTSSVYYRHIFQGINLHIIDALTSQNIS